MGFTFRAKCNKCGNVFKTSPATLNSTGYLGEAGKNLTLPKCPKCGNFRDNRLFNVDGTLSEPLRT